MENLIISYINDYVSSSRGESIVFMDGEVTMCCNNEGFAVSSLYEREVGAERILRLIGEVAPTMLIELKSELLRFLGGMDSSGVSLDVLNFLYK